MAVDPRAERWLDRVRAAPGPAYLALSRALAEAVAAGDLQPGDRLPPQRAVAAHLGLDLTTVTRGYAAARAAGLLEGAVGRGSFVRRPASADEAGGLDLSMNLPPPPQGLSLAALLQETLADILARSEAATLMAYHPQAGTLRQRAAGAAWLRPTLGEITPDRLLLAPGAQAALVALLGHLAAPGEAVVVDRLTYPGLISAATRLGLRLVPCAGDAEGTDPDAFADALGRSGAKLAYLQPTLHNPLTTTLSESRRTAMIEAARRAGAKIIEDDPYSRLMDAPPPALAALALERTYHLATLSKCLSPGLRIAYLVGPPGEAEGLSVALRATAQMPPPLMAAAATAWILEGQAERLLAGVRREARARRALAARALPMAAGGADSLHLWIPLGSAQALAQVRSAAQARGLAIVAADAFATAPASPFGLRVSLGAARDRRLLAAGLERLAAVIVEAQ